MRSNLNTVAKHAGAYFCWEVPDEGVVVRFPLNLLDLLEQEAIRACDRTTAGVLIGEAENGRPLTLTVERYEALAPELEASKSPFGNHWRVAQIVDRLRPGRKRTSILGFYRTSTREDEVLDKEDLAALGTGLSAADVDTADPTNSNREHPEGLGKRGEHSNAQTVSADGTGASLEESTYSSQAAKSLMGSSSAQPERIFLLLGTCLGRINHVTLYLVRGGSIVSYSSHAPRMAFSSAELCKQQASSEAKSPEMCAASSEAEDTEIVSDEQPVHLQSFIKYVTATWHWLTASALMAVLCVLLFYIGRMQYSDVLAYRVKPSDFHLGLKLARSGTDWELSWDQAAPILLGAANGHLRITDGVIEKTLDLAPSELRTGRIMYTPATNDVVMQLEIESARLEKPVSESVRIVAGLSPVVPGPQARAAASSQVIRDESRRPVAVGTPPDLAVKHSYKGSAIPSAMAAPLPEASVKSQKPLTSTPRITAAADEPAAEPPALGASPILDGRVALVASKQPSPPVAADPAPSVPLRGGKAEPAQLISQRDPVYPLAAKLANISGTVETHFKISTNGEVRDVTVTKGNPALIRAAIDAVRGWRYVPARLNGIPVEAEGTAVVAFKLN